MSSFQKTFSAIALLLFAALSFAAVVEAHDPIGLLGWLFCVAVALTADLPSPQADPEMG